MTREEILLIAKPILFNTDMVYALMMERKSETRRLVKLRYKRDEYGFQVITHEKSGVRYIEKVDENENSFDPERHVKPPYQIGDYLYVRETWCNVNKPGIKPDYYYFADTRICEDYDSTEWTWRPSIHMPKEAARIFLRVTGVRVERLQDITIEQVLEEGVDVKFPAPRPNYVSLAYAEMRLKPAMREQFSKLWNSTVPKKDLDKYGWNANPWVWVIEFERVEV